jgi:hypothetical protein
MSKVYSQHVAKVQTLVAGLKENVDLLKNKGIDAPFIKKLESENSLAAVYNQECDKLKAEVKAKTTQSNAKLNEVKRMALEAKKIIKRDFDKSRWPEFGISDLR